MDRKSIILAGLAVVFAAVLLVADDACLLAVMLPDVLFAGVLTSSFGTAFTRLSISALWFTIIVP